MKKYLIYPFDRRFDYILENKDKLKDIIIESLVSPLGWGRIGERVGIEKEYLITNEFSTGLEKCDGVWIVNSEMQLDFYSMILPKVLEAVRKKKQILFSRRISEENKLLIRKIVPEQLLIYQKLEKIEDNLKVLEIYPINTPIIAIIGVTENTNKAKTAIQLHNNFKKLGIEILTLSMDECTMVEGVRGIPEFIFDKCISNQDKIIGFNHYIKRLEKQEIPELIIIEIPGEAVPFSNKITGDFGMLAFAMLKSIAPDITILNTAYENFTYITLQGVIKNVQEYLNVNVDYCNIIPRIIDLQLSNLNEQLQFVELNPKKVYQRVKDMNCNNAYCLYEQQDMNRIIKNIMIELRGEEYGM